jgi:hypothetical protein
MARPAEQSLAWDYRVQQVRYTNPVSGKPSIFFANVREDTGEELGVTSEQYGLVQNSELMDVAHAALEKAGLKGFNQRVIVTGGGSRVFAEFEFGNKTEQTQVGDIFGYQLRMKNSFDRSLRAAVELFFKRLACKNGMATLERESSMNQKHSQKINVDFVAKAIDRVLGKGHDAMLVYRILMDKEIDNEKGCNILKHLELSEKLREEIQTLWLNPRRELDKPRNLYSLYNAATEHLTHKVEGERYEYANKLSHGILFALVNAARNKDTFSKIIVPFEEKDKVIVTASGPILPA